MFCMLFWWIWVIDVDRLPLPQTLSRPLSRYCFLFIRQDFLWMWTHNRRLLPLHISFYPNPEADEETKAVFPSTILSFWCDRGKWRREEEVKTILFIMHNKTNVQTQSLLCNVWPTVQVHANLLNLITEILIDPLCFYWDQWSASHASKQVTRRVCTGCTCTWSHGWMFQFTVNPVLSFIKQTKYCTWPHSYKRNVGGE